MSKFPQERVARAWFDTVLNPLIRGLREEQAQLVKGNLTWRVPGRFAALLTVREHLSPEAWDNLDQMVRHYPKLKVEFERHDQRLSELENRVFDYWTALRESEEMAALLRQAILETTETQGLGGYSFGYQDEFLQYAAEYIVNGVEELPGYYNLSVPWNRRAKEFLALRSKEPFARFFAGTQEAAAALRDSSARLTESLTELREQISMELDVPIVAA